MNDNLFDAREELKRADHLIFVSLKYTRTCDVLQHILTRLSNSLIFMFSSLLDTLEEEGKIDEIPKAPIPKAKIVRENFSSDEEIVGFVDLFFKLRKASKADFTRDTEFRRHVNLTCIVDDEMMRVDIDAVELWYKQIRDFFVHVQKIVDPESLE